MKTQIHINNSDMGDMKPSRRQGRFLLNRGAFGVDDKTLWGYGQNIVAPRTPRAGGRFDLRARVAGVGCRG
ncbi:MAG: hypothetical protein ACYST6_07830 [Planctomycetota bacterium]